MNEKNMKIKVPMLALSLVSLAFIALCFVIDTIFLKSGLKAVIYDIYILVPPVLVMLYVLRLHKSTKAKFVMSLIFALIAATPVCYSIVFGLDSLIHGVNNFRTLFAVTVIAFLLATISVAKGFSEKILAIAITAGLLVECANLIFNVPIIKGFLYDDSHMRLIALLWLFEPLGRITLYVAFLLFSLKGKRVSDFVLPPDKAIEDMSPEQALKALKEKFEQGVISEEEYSAKRAEIINKL